MRDGRPKRGSHAPGTFWYYNNWDFNVLGTVFRQLTGADIFVPIRVKASIAGSLLFQPFGHSMAAWIGR